MIRRLLKIIQLSYRFRILHAIFNFIFRRRVFSDVKNVQFFAKNLHIFLESLGVTFIKLGQNLSVYAHTIHPEIIKELEKLQDQCTPLEIQVIKNVLRDNYGENWKKIFLKFDEKPIATASMAQVHTAYLKQQKVILKILRPDAKLLIQNDLHLLSLIINFLHILFPIIRQIKAKKIITVLKNHLEEESNFLSEAAKTNQLQRLCLKNKLPVLIPSIHWNQCTQDVLVETYLPAESIRVLWENNQRFSPEEKRKIAENILSVLMHQIFEYNFFHADMHPGNIMIGSDNRYIMVDFGCTDSLSEKNQKYIALNFLAFLENDYKRFTQLHIESGWLNPKEDNKRFENAIRCAFEPILHQSPEKIEVGSMLMKLFKIANDFHFNIDPELVYLQKTLLNTESICRKINPNINTWHFFHPFLKKWVKNKFPQTIWKNIPSSIQFPIETAYHLHHMLLQQAKHLEYLPQSTQKKNKKIPLLFISIVLILQISILWYFF